MRYVPLCVVIIHPLATSSTLVFWPCIWTTLPIPRVNGLPSFHFFEDEEGRKIFPWPKSFAEIVGFPKKLWFTTCSQGWLTGIGLELTPKEVEFSSVRQSLVRRMSWNKYTFLFLNILSNDSFFCLRRFWPWQKPHVESPFIFSPSPQNSSNSMFYMSISCVSLGLWGSPCELHK